MPYSSKPLSIMPHSSSHHNIPRIQCTFTIPDYAITQPTIARGSPARPIISAYMPMGPTTPNIQQSNWLVSTKPAFASESTKSIFKTPGFHCFSLPPGIPFWFHSRQLQSQNLSSLWFHSCQRQSQSIDFPVQTSLVTHCSIHNAMSVIV